MPSENENPRVPVQFDLSQPLPRRLVRYFFEWPSFLQSFYPRSFTKVAFLTFTVNFFMQQMMMKEDTSLVASCFILDCFKNNFLLLLASTTTVGLGILLSHFFGQCFSDSHSLNRMINHECLEMLGCLLLVSSAYVGYKSNKAFNTEEHSCYFMYEGVSSFSHIQAPK